MQDLIALVGELRRRGIGFTSLHEALDTTTPGGRLVFHVFAALAEFIRELIVQGTKEGWRQVVVCHDVEGCRAHRTPMPAPVSSLEPRLVVWRSHGAGSCSRV